MPKNKSIMEREADWLERHSKSLLGNGDDLVGAGLTQRAIKDQIKNLHYVISHRYLNTEALRAMVRKEEKTIRFMRDRVELLERRITPITKVTTKTQTVDEELLDLLSSMPEEELELWKTKARKGK